ncbi:tumor necrosis factor receptor superfamily member 16-like [Anguilla anguilla]|uniref:tumor necrosis factor receptor superfamily member 16-like n=1 Tax=Anguilla anguilla TaxID=7936 RepID=UPI0015AD269B|nr:tumor necrosis factor receptor superfamily member 16-like [Anguilla anguilla]
MRTLMLMVLLGAMEVLAAQSDCESGQHTSDGECCLQCQPGEGVVQKCGAKQTVCAQCLDSETFSENYSHTEVCQPCTQCTGLFRMLTPCTDSNDAVCVCDYGYYLSSLTGHCRACTACPLGHGVVEGCAGEHDTVCDECLDDTYSDQESSLDPCLPCSICEEGVELEMRPCSPINDAICRDPTLPSASPSPSDSPFPFTEGSRPEFAHSPAPTESGTTASSTKVLTHGFNENLIPIYCSILAAVVVGLLAYIIFKRWNSCKQNKQAANNRTVNQTPSPEGEKLHSDSGISVDSQSLQEQQQQQQQQQQQGQQTQAQAPAQTVVRMDGGPSSTLPPHKCEEVERLLNGGGGAVEQEEGRSWCSLAGLLGYEEEHIASFQQEEHPVRALLSDWASKDCASVDALCTALRKINRDDIARSLAPLQPQPHGDPTATSAV